MSDGETVEEALANGVDAVRCWITIAKEQGREIVEPDNTDNIGHESGKWVQRVPRSLHTKLRKKAKLEHVSLNTLVVSILAEALGLGSKHQHH